MCTIWRARSYLWNVPPVSAHPTLFWGGDTGSSRFNHPAIAPSETGNKPARPFPTLAGRQEPKCVRTPQALADSTYPHLAARPPELELAQAARHSERNMRSSRRRALAGPRDSRPPGTAGIRQVTTPEASADRPHPGTRVAGFVIHRAARHWAARHWAANRNLVLHEACACGAPRDRR
jgi:hypothetical protein